jgi:hypothetical protein
VLPFKHSCISNVVTVPLAVIANKSPELEKAVVFKRNPSAMSSVVPIRFFMLLFLCGVFCA